MTTNLGLYAVRAVLVLDAADGARIFAKYFSSPHGAKDTGGSNSAFASLREQRAFEKNLHEKTNKQTNDIVIFENHIIVYKPVADIVLFVVGGLNENEVLLCNVVSALREALDILLKRSFDKVSVLENFDLVALAVDELVDDGIILDIDGVAVAGRVSHPPQHDTGAKIELNEQGLFNAYKMAKTKLERFQDRLGQY